MTPQIHWKFHNQDLSCGLFLLFVNNIFQLSKRIHLLNFYLSSYSVFSLDLFWCWEKKRGWSRYLGIIIATHKYKSINKYKRPFVDLNSHFHLDVVVSSITNQTKVSFVYFSGCFCWWDFKNQTYMLWKLSTDWIACYIDITPYIYIYIEKDEDKDVRLEFGIAGMQLEDGFDRNPILLCNQTLLRRFTVTRNASQLHNPKDYNIYWSKEIEKQCSI